MSLEVHLYRRGSVYWWRRVLPACGAAVGDGGAPENFLRKSPVGRYASPCGQICPASHSSEGGVTVGLPVPAAETAEHSYLARLVLRGLPCVHRINAEREQNHYDDHLEDVLPPLPASSMAVAMPVGAPSGNAVPGAGGRPAIVLAPQAPVPTAMPAQAAAQSFPVVALEASIDTGESSASPIPARTEAEAHPHSQTAQPAVAAAD